MCGFLGEFSYKNEFLSTSEDFTELLNLSKHRGPDNTTTYKFSNFQLGFNRLAILDISEAGNQPKKSPSGRYHMVFNGEVYNFKSLKEKYYLANLKSTSDTEVISHLLDVLGIEQTIKELNGMFAIAIVDTKDNNLFLTRDFAGIKPLFYGISKQGIVSASQFNQVFKHSWFRSEIQLRKEIVKEYFGLGYMQAPNTIYQNIFQVKPGELIKFSKNGTIKKTILLTYSHSIENNVADGEIKNVEKFDKIINQVINRQMVSDVPLASFLSGGIDSPLVCAIAKKQKPSINTFTLGVDHKKYDESKKAVAYAKHIKVKNKLEFIKPSELMNTIDEHFQFFTEPFGDYSSIPTFLITKKAKKEHTVMLSGDGGDELFFGYPRMLDVLQKRNWFKVPFQLRRPLVRLAIKLKLLDSWAPYMYKNIEEWILGKHLHIPKHHLNKLFPNISFSNELNNLYTVPEKCNKKALLNWLRYNEFYAHLQRVLVKVDRMSMGNSLEVRVPFLDKESIDFAWDIIPKIEKNRFYLKGLLKEVMALYYPKKIIEQQKKGFAVPIEDWLHTNLKTDLKKVIFETPVYGEELIDIKELKQYVTDYLDDKHHDSWGIWHIYAWQKWAIVEGLILK